MRGMWAWLHVARIHARSGATTSSSSRIAKWNATYLASWNIKLLLVFYSYSWYSKYSFNIHKSVLNWIAINEEKEQKHNWIYRTISATIYAREKRSEDDNASTIRLHHLPNGTWHEQSASRVESSKTSGTRWMHKKMVDERVFHCTKSRSLHSPQHSSIGRLYYYVLYEWYMRCSNNHSNPIYSWRAASV